MSRAAMVVDALMGICVHDPDTLVEPPSDRRDWAEKALAENLPGALLSPQAKTEFLIAHGAMSFKDSAAAAAKDLPEQAQLFMSNNGLDPSNYDLQPFIQEWHSTLRVLCLAAVRKGSLARPQPGGVYPSAADVQATIDSILPASEAEAPVAKKPRRVGVWLVVAIVAVIIIACLAVTGGGIQDFFQSIVNGLSTGSTSMP